MHTCLLLGTPSRVHQGRVHGQDGGRTTYKQGTWEAYREVYAHQGTGRHVAQYIPTQGG